MPNASLNNVTAPDAYTQAATIDSGMFVDRINLDVANQAIIWQLKESARGGPPGQASWQAEVLMLPGSRTLTRPFVTGLRFRAATLAANLPAGATQAAVTVELVS